RARTARMIASHPSERPSPNAAGKARYTLRASAAVATGGSGGGAQTPASLFFACYLQGRGSAAASARDTRDPRKRGAVLPLREVAGSLFDHYLTRCRRGRG